MLPTLTSHRAIELLRAKIAEIDALKSLHYDSPGIRKWTSTTEAILVAAFGRPQGADPEALADFKAAYRLFFSDNDWEEQREYCARMDRRRAILESCIEQLELLAPPIAQVDPSRYVFHAEIERVSGDLFRSGYYKQAALEAYIRVIEEVKQRSGLLHDGDNLMNQAFSQSGERAPVLCFNSLANDAERDEQKGFMFLFKGMVLHRNFKAHSNQLFNDPLRAHDYLSFASLLMRVLESSTKT